MCTCAGAKQADAAAQAGTSTKSIQKCKPLAESVIGVCAAGVALAGTTALVGPTAEASLVVLLQLSMVLPLRVKLKALPNVTKCT